MLRAAGRLAVQLLLAASLLVFLFLGVGPHTGAYRTMTVLSGSMEPSLGAGAVAIVRSKPLTEMAVGDVLVYQIPVEDRRTVAHRVVEVIEPGATPVVRTKGDANPHADHWDAELHGTAWIVRASVPALGHLVLALRQPLLRTLLLYGAPLLLVGVTLQHIWGLRLPRRAGPAMVLTAVVVTVAVSAAPALAAFSGAAARSQQVSTGTVLAPATLSGTNSCLLGSNRIDLAWPATTDSLSTAYELQRSQAGGTFQAHATFAVSTLSYADTGLAAGTSYQYRIRSTRGTWTSAWTTSPVIATRPVTLLLVCL